jgi:iron-sulfur cluster repair protein YtfE (RIC family)
MTTTMANGRQVIRAFVEHEHQDLEVGIERIHESAEDLPRLSVDQKSASVSRVLRWVDEVLKPHMAWEESWLFPQIDDRERTPWVTRLVRFDHRQIAQQAERLHTHTLGGHRGTPDEARTLVVDLSGLEALLRANLEREEQFLLPLLETEADRWAPEWRD